MDAYMCGRLRNSPTLQHACANVRGRPERHTHSPGGPFVHGWQEAIQMGITTGWLHKEDSCYILGSLHAAKT